MKRRDFMTLFASTVAAWPLAARAEQAMPVVGFLSGRAPEDSAEDAAAFRQGLNEMGYVIGRNVALEYRWSEGHDERLSELAAELVRRQVAVIAAVGGNNSAFAAKAATAEIPIVFTSAADPVTVGLVTSLNRPGSNVTGVSWFGSDSLPKRMAILGELVPNIKLAVLLVNPNMPEINGQPEAAQQTAQALGWQLQVVEARSASDIDAAFADAKRQGADAVIISASPFFRTRRGQLLMQAARHAIPTIYANRATVMGGGLISYGNSVPDAYRRAGLQTGRILRGAKPGELPVDRAVKFELVINLNTAKMLGLEVPATLLARADEVID
jgi:putative tryptophan/tyrosine transport system substrate-binding protein